MSPDEAEVAVREADAEAMARMVNSVCRALVAAVLCVTGSCTISQVCGPRDPAPAPRCAQETKVDGLTYPRRCEAPAAYCGLHHGGGK